MHVHSFSMFVTFGAFSLILKRKWRQPDAVWSVCVQTAVLEGNKR